ncbi:TIGR01212 family radical SAM protein [Hydrogenivirga sp.]
MERIRYFRLYAKEHFGRRVRKIPVALPFTCPNIDGTKGRGGCIYCYRGSRPEHLSPRQGVREQIEEGMSRARERYGRRTAFFVYFQSYTNTYGSAETLKDIYDVVLDYDEVVGIDVGTRPDCAPEEVLGLLSSYKEKGLEVWIEFGLQSANYETLKRINRAHGVSDLVDATLRAKRKGLKVCIHTIVGLPGEGEEDFLETARLVSALGAEGVKIHPVYVMRNTGLAKLYERKEFRPLSLGEYAYHAARMLELLPEETVVHRLTAEAKKPALLAPDYCTYERKLEVVRAIEEELARRGSRQGFRRNEGLALVKGA